MGQRGTPRNALTVRLNFSVVLGPKLPSVGGTAR